MTVSGAKYYASRKSGIVCIEGCYHVRNIHPKHLIEYATLERAVNDGHRLCTDCLQMML